MSDVTLAMAGVSRRSRTGFLIFVFSLFSLLIHRELLIGAIYIAFCCTSVITSSRHLIFTGYVAIDVRHDVN